MQFLTIGVYGFSELEFFEALVENQVELFIDIRQRRGVRGKKYSFVNSKYLQSKLEELEIQYIHKKELAPTTEIREAQKKADELRGVSKSQRIQIGTIFRDKYISMILSNFELEQYAKKLESQYKNVVLFCVESTPKACHRGIVAEELMQLGYSTRHITK
ncbi:DUF488 family protein [Bacillus cereus group sp. MYBK120-1]|uniref:DUF488 domain-containing protein n=1 Tax=Bacillus cereus group TaxID=86661 RepID=UPI00234C187B|nr:DUF488 domain-containing protein [Bacillus cereus]MDC7729667.1 DUF488 domain-containing protein [Bacillus cereus]